MSDLFDGYIITIPTIGTISTGTGILTVEDQDGSEENVSVQANSGTEASATSGGNSYTQAAVDEWNSFTLDELKSSGRITQNYRGKYYYRIINVATGPYDTLEECIDAYRYAYFTSQGIDVNTISPVLKSGSDFVNGTMPPSTNVTDLLLGRVKEIRTSLSPWGILSENVAIDMGPVRGISTDLLIYIQIAGIFVGILLILTAIIGYIGAQEAQLKSRYKASVMQRIYITCMITGALIFLSVLMDICNLIFLV